MGRVLNKFQSGRMAKSWRWRVVEMEGGGDGTMWKYLTPLNCILRNG